MKLENLEEVLKNEKNFRKTQIAKAIFGENIEEIDKITTIPKDLKERLNKSISLKIDAEIFEDKTKKTIKALIKLSDNLKIESVLIRHKGRNTVCVSSQVGCNMGCKFCATGKLGLSRNLKTYEILEQILFFSRLLKKEEQRVNSAVFMGMGEPLLNYKNVLEAIRKINDKNYFNIGIRHISISTCGIISGIKKLSDEKLGINLAYSLHFANEEKRGMFMPISKANKIKDTMEEIKNYIIKTGRKIMIEYIMLKNINDQKEDAILLSNLLKNYEIETIKGKNKAPHYFVNLIPYNPDLNSKDDDFSPSDKQSINNFKKILEKEGIDAVERFSYGKELSGACGQLALKNFDN